MSYVGTVEKERNRPASQLTLLNRQNPTLWDPKAGAPPQMTGHKSVAPGPHGYGSSHSLAPRGAALGPTSSKQKARPKRHGLVGDQFGTGKPWAPHTRMFRGALNLSWCLGCVDTDQLISWVVGISASSLQIPTQRNSIYQPDLKQI